MPGPLTITYFNNTRQTTFSGSSSYTGYQLQEGIDHIVHSPEDPLEPGRSSTFEVSINALAKLANGGTSISLGYKDSHTDQHFGAKIILTTQILSIGGSPYYQVAYGTSGPNWFTPVSDPSMSYTFPTSVGNKITLSPTSGHTSLALNILIEDL